MLSCKFGFLIQSTALVADSFDMLGDALVYGISYYAVIKSNILKTTSALIKGWMMMGFGLFVLAQAIYKFYHPVVPDFGIMASIGVMALAVNLFCFYSLMKHRKQDINMRSVWICSRNDVIANVLIILAAVGILLTQSQWPDLVVGMFIGVIFLRSALGIIREAHSIKTSELAKTVEL